MVILEFSFSLNLIYMNTTHVILNGYMMHSESFDRSKSDFTCMPWWRGWPAAICCALHWTWPSTWSQWWSTRSSRASHHRQQEACKPKAVPWAWVKILYSNAPCCKADDSWVGSTLQRILTLGASAPLSDLAGVAASLGRLTAILLTFSYFCFWALLCSRISVINMG